MSESVYGYDPGLREVMITAQKIAKELEAIEREVDAYEEGRPLSTKLPITGRVKVSDLHVDHTYQRPISVARVARMVARFDPTLVGVVLVNMRKDGTMAVIDGQHRVVAMHELDPELHVDALIYDALPLDEEARIYWLMQRERRSLTPYDQFKAAVVAGDEEALVIQALLDKLGLTLIPNNEQMDSRQIRSVSAVVDTYRKGGLELAEEILRILMTVWPDEPDMMRDVHIRGLRLLLSKFGDAVNTERLIEKMATVTPIQLRRMAASHQLLDGKGSGDKAYARAIAELYNGRLRSDQRLRWE